MTITPDYFIIRARAWRELGRAHTLRPAKIIASVATLEDEQFLKLTFLIFMLFLARADTFLVEALRLRMRADAI